MGITVEEAMEIGGLRGQKVICGHLGMKNIIKHVSVLEVPNVEGWFRGQELFLTAFYAIGNDLSAQLDLLRNMKKMNAAGLVVFYPGRYYEKLHPSFIDLSNELAIPVIEIKEEIPYLEFISPIMKRVHIAEQSYLAHIISLHQYFPDWIDMELSLHQITKKLSKHIGKSISITNENFNLISQAGEEKELEAIDRWLFINQRQIKNKLKRQKQFQYDNKMIHITTIETKREKLGYHIILSNEIIDDMLLNIISINLVLYMSHPSTRNEFNAVRKENLIRQWLSNKLKLKEVHYHAREINWNIDSIVGLGLISSFDLKTLKRELLKQDHTMDWFETTEFIGFFIYKENIGRYSVSEYLHHITEAIDMDFQLAYKASDTNFIADCEKVFNSLSKLITLQKKIPNLPTVMDLNCFPLIEALKSKQFVAPFLRLIEPLTSHKNSPTDLELFTTFVYLLFNNNSGNVATELHIHRNTLNYRRQRIIEILGENPFEPTQIAQYQIAVFATYLFVNCAPAQHIV